MGDSRIEYDSDRERYPNRAVAVEQARRRGLSEEAIAEVESMLIFGGDTSPDEWFRLIRSAYDRIRRGEPAHRTPTAGERAEAEVQAEIDADEPLD